MWPCFYLMLETCSKCLTRGQLMKIICECTHGAFHTCCVTLFFGSMAVFICAYEFVFMHVHVHACACVHLCVCVATSYGPSGLRVCHLECQVSMCPRTPLFLVLQRPWTACVCLFVCIALQEDANTALVKVIMNCVCVKGVVFTCVYWPLTSPVSLRITAVRR